MIHKKTGQNRCAKSHSFNSLAGSIVHFKIKMIKIEENSPISVSLKWNISYFQISGLETKVEKGFTSWLGCKEKASHFYLNIEYYLAYVQFLSPLEKLHGSFKKKQLFFFSKGTAILLEWLKVISNISVQINFYTSSRPQKKMGAEGKEEWRERKLLPPDWKEIIIRPLCVHLHTPGQGSNFCLHECVRSRQALNLIT